MRGGRVSSPSILKMSVSAGGCVRLTAIERKNILKAAEQLCKSVHCKFASWSPSERARDFQSSVPVAVATV